MAFWGRVLFPFPRVLYGLRDDLVVMTESVMWCADSEMAWECAGLLCRVMRVSSILLNETGGVTPSV